MHLKLRLFILAAASCPGLCAQQRDGMEYVIKDTIMLALFKSTIKKLEHQDNVPELARSLKRVGDYYYKTGPDDSTLSYYKRALKQYETIPDSFYISYCYYRIGELAAYWGKDPDAAIAWHMPAARYFERAGEYRMAAFSNYAISTDYKAKGNPVAAQQYFKQATSFNSIAKDTLLDIIMINSALDDLRKEKKWKELFDRSKRVVELSRLARHPIFEKVGLLQMGTARLHDGDPASAVNYLEESYRVNANTDAAHPEALRLLAIAHIRLHHHEEAENYMSLFKQVSDSIAKKKENDHYQDMLVQFETEKKQSTIAALEQDKLLSETRTKNQKLFIALLIGGLGILVVAGWTILSNTRKRQKLEERLHRQQEEFAQQLQQQKEESMMADFNKQLAEVQLTALSTQMNPHFIFNCMNSIQKYILKNEKAKALDFLQHFSELMRSVLDNSVRPKVALDEEINMLEKYILLEQQRLDHQFDYRIEINAGIQADFFEIPGMIIQPYVENAIWHGLMNKTEKGLLQLRFEKEGDSLKCVVEDDGVGRIKAAEIEQYQSPKRKSYGMAIAQKRLELLEKEKKEIPRILIEDLYRGNGPAGTRVTIFIRID